MTLEEIRLAGNFKAKVNAEHRSGFCENCGTTTEKQFYMDGKRKRVRMVCPQCGGQGRLIARSVGIQPPNAPQCLKPRCLWRFFKDVLFCGVLSKYHKLRVTYAETNRHIQIPQHYRTGEKSPQNIPQALCAIVRLKLRR